MDGQERGTRIGGNLCAQINIGQIVFNQHFMSGEMLIKMTKHCFRHYFSGQCDQRLRPRPPEVGRVQRQGGGEQGGQREQGGQGEQGEAEPRGQDRVPAQPQEEEHGEGDGEGKVETSQEISVHGHPEQEEARRVLISQILFMK